MANRNGAQTFARIFNFSLTSRRARNDPEPIYLLFCASKLIGFLILLELKRKSRRPCDQQDDGNWFELMTSTIPQNNQKHRNSNTPRARFVDNDLLRNHRYHTASLNNARSIISERAGLQRGEQATVNTVSMLIGLLNREITEASILSNESIGKKMPGARSDAPERLAKTASIRLNQLFTKALPRIGKQLIDRFPISKATGEIITGKPDEHYVYAYRDYLTPAAQWALQQARSDPRWKEAKRDEKEAILREWCQRGLDELVPDFHPIKPVGGADYQAEIEAAEAARTDEERLLSEIEAIARKAEKKLDKEIETAVNKLLELGDPGRAASLARHVSRLFQEKAATLTKLAHNPTLQRETITQPLEVVRLVYPQKPQASLPYDQTAGDAISESPLIDKGSVILSTGGEIETEAEAAAIGLENEKGAIFAPQLDAKLNESSTLETAIFPDELRAVEAFASVGGEIDQALLIADTLPANDQILAAPHLDTAAFLANLPRWKERAALESLSIVGRVRGPVLQIDDCDEMTASLLRHFAFVVIETSPANFQCWLAFKDDTDKEATRQRLFRGLKTLLPQTQANHGSGGAVRWPGTTNHKPNRQQADGSYPLVRVACVNRGQVVTPSLLDEVGLLAPEELPKAATMPTRRTAEVRTYSHYLAAAPKRQRDNQPDRSRADQSFVNQLIGAGWGDEDICVELMAASERAKEKGLAYARRTIQSGRSYCGAEERA